jgi:hypothetical protein
MVLRASLKSGAMGLCSVDNAILVDFSTMRSIKNLKPNISSPLPISDVYVSIPLGIEIVPFISVYEKCGFCNLHDQHTPIFLHGAVHKKWHDTKGRAACSECQNRKKSFGLSDLS